MLMLMLTFIYHYYQPNPMITHIVGTDASGKSTTLKNLKETFPATYIREPYHPDIISQLTTTTSIFEKIKLFALDRHRLYSTLNLNSSTPIISDRSFICNLVYQSLELESQHNFTPYSSIKHILDAQLSIHNPTLVIYIHAEPQTIYNRLSHRTPDHHMTIPTINAIQARYELVLTLLNFNTLKIDTTNTSPSTTLSTITTTINNITKNK